MTDVQHSEPDPTDEAEILDESTGETGLEDDEDDGDDLIGHVEASFSPEAHPRAPAGGNAGGEFTAGDNGGDKKPKAKPRQRKPRRTIPKGSLGFDGQRGTGYGEKGGDAATKELQTELNRLGVTDAQHRKLSVDGQFGPLTTQSVKAAQRALGMQPTGVVTPAFIDRLKSLKSLPTPAKKTHAAANEPYGSVEYADPGYQADGKKRYPLDSVDHCRAAWSYINQQANAAKYTADQLAQIKARIQAAGKKYGITFDGNRAMAAALHNVELARPGKWQLSSGEQQFTADMLHAAARYAGRAGARPAPVKLGHVDDRFDGEPAFGWLGNLRVEEDDQGPVLLGDITGMPDWLAAAAPTAWPDRSVEGWTDFVADGETFPFVIDGLALLGVTPPGISSIKSLRDLPAALGIAASARIVARAPGATLQRVAATKTPAPEAEEPIKKGAGMDPAKIREACGLPADASDDEVKSTLVAAGYVPAAPEPVAAAAKDAPGTMRVDASAWQEREERLARLEREAQRHRDGERDQIIASAVKDGKFAPSRKQHWSRLWDADPEGTREVIAGLAKGVMPTAELGYADGEAEADELYTALYGKAKVS